MTNTDQFDEIEIKDDSTPVRHLNAQYRIPEPRKVGISVSPIRHPDRARTSFGAHYHAIFKYVNFFAVQQV